MLDRNRLHVILRDRTRKQVSDQLTPTNLPELLLVHIHWTARINLAMDLAMVPVAGQEVLQLVRKDPIALENNADRYHRAHIAHLCLSPKARAKERARAKAKTRRKAITEANRAAVTMAVVAKAVALLVTSFHGQKTTRAVIIFCEACTQQTSQKLLDQAWL